jgi:outer membrane receptor protein involved in Fe transport
LRFFSASALLCLTFASAAELPPGDSALVKQHDSAKAVDSSSSTAAPLPATVLKPDSASKIHELDRIIVTASRRQRLLEASQSLAIIRPEEWTGTTKSVADVVAEQTGVQTRRYGGAGSFQTVSIRGVQGNEVQVLLDGIPLNSAMGGAVDLGAINPDRIGEIEVYKGTTPGEFGGNAMGGVINIKSRTGIAAQSLSAQSAIGAYGYRKFSVENSHPFSERFNLFGSLCYVKSDNDWPYLDRNKTPYNTADDAVRSVENNRYDFFEGRLHPSLMLPGGRTWASGLSYSTSAIGIPALEGSVNKTAKHSQTIFQITSRLSNDDASKKNTVTVTPEIGYLHWFDNTFWTSLDSSMGTYYGAIAALPNSWGESTSDLQIAHISCITDIDFSDNLTSQVTLHGKYSDIGSSTRVTGFPQGDWPGNSEELSIAIDGNGSIPVGAVKLGANCGAAVKAVRSATAGGKNDLLITTVLPSDTVEYPWSAHAGLQCLMEKLFNAFVNIARYSNLPSLRDKYGSKGAVLPNPDLREETGTTAEAGARFMREHFWFEATAFTTETENGIWLLPGKDFTKPVNLAAQLTKGIEASCWMEPAKYLRGELRMTLQKAENRSRLYNYYGKRLPGEPDLSLLARLSVGPFKGVTTDYWLDYKSAFFRDWGNTERVPDDPAKPGLLFHNAKISWKISSHFNSSLSIRNFSGTSLRYEEMARSAESGYSWILYPANEWCLTMGYSF